MTQKPQMLRVRFLPSERCVEVPPGTTLLEAAREAGLPVATACGAEGLCGRCGMQIVEGETSLSPETSAEQEIRRANRVALSLRLSCRIELTPRGEDLVVTAPYW